MSPGLVPVRVNVNSVSTAGPGLSVILSNDVLPGGITVLQARQYVIFAAQDAKVAYLHICEGASQLADGRKNETTGKLISYLVSDFIKELSQE